MTVTCRRHLFVVDMAPTSSSGFDPEPERSSVRVCEHPYQLEHEQLCLQAAASISGRCSGRAIPVCGRLAVAKPANTEPAPPLLATSDGTVMATSVPVPVPQPSEDFQSALRAKRSSKIILQVTSCLLPPQGAVKRNCALP